MATAATPDPGNRNAAVVGVLAVLTLLGFVALALVVRSGGNAVVSSDHRLADALHRVALRHPGQVRIWADISTVFAPDVWRVAAVPAAIVLWVRHRRADAAFVAITVLGTGLWSTLGKLLVDRDRPSFVHPVAVAGGQSYPSGHALTSFVACAVLVVVCSSRWRRRIAAPAVLVVLAVGASRLVLGVHFLSDVLGGWLLGTAWLCAMVLAVRAVSKRRRAPG